MSQNRPRGGGVTLLEGSTTQVPGTDLREVTGAIAVLRAQQSDETGQEDWPVKDLSNTADNRSLIPTESLPAFMSTTLPLKDPLVTFRSDDQCYLLQAPKLLEHKPAQRIT